MNFYRIYFSGNVIPIEIQTEKDIAGIVSRINHDIRTNCPASEVKLKGSGIEACINSSRISSVLQINEEGEVL